MYRLYLMSNIPSELRYTKSHEWVRFEDDGTATVGITEHAAESLGEVVFVELPELGETYNQTDDIAVVESVKAASDLYAPFSGEVIAVNDTLSDTPEIVNEDPYGKGWFFKFKIHSDSELDSFLDASGYAEILAD